MQRNNLHCRLWFMISRECEDPYGLILHAACEGGRRRLRTAPNERALWLRENEVLTLIIADARAK